MRPPQSAKTSILSMIDPDDKKDVTLFLKSSSPTDHNGNGNGNSLNLNGCANANNNTDLASIIDSASDGDTVLLCPGKVTFNDEIVLTKSITIECAGTKGSCIFDGNENNRHFFSETSSITLVFIALVFINGFADDASSTASQCGGAEGGSVFFLGGSTSIFIDSLFYNNLATSSNDFAVSIIYECTHVKGLLYCYCQYFYYCNTHLFHCSFTLFLGWWCNYCIRW